MARGYALVTGGSSGIGLELAGQLAARGYGLLLISDQEERLAELQKEIPVQYPARVNILAMDLARPGAARDVFDFCEREELQIDVLVNNAGFFFFSEITEADPERVEHMIMLHVLTVSQLCALFGRRMAERKKGYILNVSSISAYRAFPAIAHYGSTKAYIRYFTRSLRTEMKPHGVHVCCLSPGATATNLYDPTVIDVERGKRFGIMMDAGKVATQGLKCLFANRAESVPGFVTRIMLGLSRVVPQWIIQRLFNRRMG